MNRKIYIFIISLGLTASLSSCEDDFEAVPLEQNTLDFVFSRTDSLGEAAKQYLNTVYSQMQNGHNRVGGDYLDAASDDAVSSAITTPDVTRLVNGAYTPSSTIGSDMRWESLYAGIRTASTFITNINVVPLKDKTANGIPVKSAWRSEARFIRALHYFDLVKRYGGVPLMGDHVRSLGEDVELPRNTFEECINYIVAECDAIKDSLRTYPIADPQNNGHVVTKEAALALKTRVLLYAASPLFNGGNIDASNPLTGYTGYDAGRWKSAADAAREFMTHNTYFTLAANFKDVFITMGNTEVIFFRSGGENTSLELENGPVGFAGANLGRGRVSPTQNLVDAFPMISGLPISDPSSGYNHMDPYANRDPRLDLTILRNGSLWLNEELKTFEGGKSKPGGALQQTRTSYYMRKFLGDFETSSSYANTVHDWIMFRYAEVLLNFAEAENEFEGPTAEVYQVIRDLRQRAGIQPGDDNTFGVLPGMTKDEMREVIRNERRIEMAFEEQRYWDIRRWKIATDVFEESLKGLVIVRSAGVLNYNLVPVLTVNAFQERQYLYPIPYDEVIKNKNLVQNPQW